jgi:hypothetical protein
MAHLLDFEFDQRMVGRVSVFGLTSFTKVKVRARAALETHSGDRRLLATVTSDPMVDNWQVDGLSKFEERMFCRMH